ncbi:uncharacterized protein METZ01_LOCUS493381 [marine metagenome]|uniref:Uncharacterized protein n=1 Tax=marine metagenome TaxID=408172 RepID=A0A383D7J2_9ZZZZ
MKENICGNHGHVERGFFYFQLLYYCFHDELFLAQVYML